MTDLLKQQIESLPDLPGVYQYFNKDGSLRIRTQTAHVLALNLGLVPREGRPGHPVRAVRLRRFLHGGRAGGRQRGGLHRPEGVLRDEDDLDVGVLVREVIGAGLEVLGREGYGA